MIKKKFGIKFIVLMGVFIVVVVVFLCFFVYEIMFLKISFMFILELLIGMIFGFFWVGIGMVVVDVVGMLFFLKVGYFFGFILNVFLVGVIYGYFYYKKEMIW